MLNLLFKKSKLRVKLYINKAEIALTHYIEYVSSVGYDYHQNFWYGYVDLDSSYQSTAQLKSDLKDSKNK